MTLNSEAAHLRHTPALCISLRDRVRVDAEVRAFYDARMGYTPRIEEAFAFAAELHRAQTRKGSGAPYLTHLMAVAACVGEHLGDEDQVIAALLHDAIEDQGVTADELARRFGPEVARIVVACTDAFERPKPPWRARKERYIAALRDEDATVKLVAVSDKLHNARSIERDHRVIGAEVWARFTAPVDETLWFYRAVTDALAHGWPHPLVDELYDVVASLEGLSRA